MQAEMVIDTFEAICDRGRNAADSLDSGRWILGELASQIKTRYGEHTIADFAIQCGVEKKRIYEYSQVYDSLEQMSIGADYRSDNPQLRYSHFRTALRLSDPAQARTFLDECSAEGWTVEQARLKLLDRLGKPQPPKKLLDCTMLLAHLPYEIKNEIAGLLNMDAAKLVRLVVTEVAA